MLLKILLVIQYPTQMLSPWGQCRGTTAWTLHITHIPACTASDLAQTLKTQVFGSAIHKGELNAIPGSWLQPDSTLGFVAIWRVNQKIKELFPHPFFLTLPFN